MPTQTIATLEPIDATGTDIAPGLSGFDFSVSGNMLTVEFNASCGAISNRTFLLQQVGNSRHYRFHTGNPDVITELCPVLCATIRQSDGLLNGYIYYQAGGNDQGGGWG